MSHYKKFDDLSCRNSRPSNKKHNYSRKHQDKSPKRLKMKNRSAKGSTYRDEHREKPSKSLIIE